MDSQIVAIFCLCDDIFKDLHHHEDRQCQMSYAEIMIMSIVAVAFFSGNMERARTFLQDYIPTMLENNRFNRR